jgi:hypothetical protein
LHLDAFDSGVSHKVALRGAAVQISAWGRAEP